MKPPTKAWPDGWRGYVTIPDDPNNDVYELGYIPEFPTARPLINRSMEYKQMIRAYKASLELMYKEARPIDEVMKEQEGMES